MNTKFRHFMFSFIIILNILFLSKSLIMIYYVAGLNYSSTSDLHYLVFEDKMVYFTIVQTFIPYILFLFCVFIFKFKWKIKWRFILSNVIFTILIYGFFYNIYISFFYSISKISILNMLISAITHIVIIIISFRLIQKQTPDVSIFL